MKDIKRIALFALLSVLIIVTVHSTSATAKSLREEARPQIREEKAMAAVQENSLVGIVSPYYVKPIVNGCIIDCLIEEESNGDPNAYNPCDTDGYPKIGCLQYHIPTFQEFCVDKYGLTNDIWDCNIQKECADLMIRDGYLYRWGTASKCTK